MISSAPVRRLSGNNRNALKEWFGLQIRWGKVWFVWLGLFSVGVAVSVTLIIGFLLWNGRTIRISGKIVSGETREPVPDALVAVESSLPYSWETTGLGQYVRTDGDGKFSANVRGEVSIRAWKPGYAMASEGASSNELSSKENVIYLRPLTSTHLIQESISKEGLAVGDGFSFERGQIVSVDDRDADFRVIKSPENGTISVEALGLGGLSYQEYAKGVDFYNTPEAPVSGYSKKLPLIPGSMGIFYVLTSDGKHYAKVRLIPGGVKHTPNGADYSAYWVQWAYQPDGSRSLEIAVCKEYLFPFERFGLERHLLK